MRHFQMWAGRGGVVLAVVSVAALMSAIPAQATEETDNAGPLNVSLTGNSAGGINDSTFIAVAPGDVAAGATFTAVSGSQAVGVYAIPVGGDNAITGADNATVWVPQPAGATTVTLTWSSGSPTTETYPTLSATTGSSISVAQDGEGSRSITATAVVPKFTGITDAFFLDPDGFMNYAFHVFDADTQEWINPGRSGVSKRIVNVGGTDMLEMVDPLVLPESALGRNIRVGFVTYYYQSAWNATPGDRTTPIPIRYAGLSAAILMRLGGSVGSGAALSALQQFAVPEGTQAEACGALAPEDVDAPALEQMRGEGWSVSYAEWPNDGAGGWVCSRQPVLTSMGWVVR